jgi:integrase/recombinase XerD
LDKRAGKVVKSDRSGIQMRKSIYDLDALFQKFYDAKVAEGRAKGTLSGYMRTFKLFADYLDQIEVRRDIREMDVDIIRSFTAWLLNDRVKWDGHKFKSAESQTKGLSPRSVNDYVKQLRSFFAFLVDEGLAQSDPTAKVKSVSQVEEEIEILEVDELKALLAAPDQRKYADFRDFVIMNLLLDTMCRIGEALTLRNRDIDFADNTVHIRGEITKTRKGRIVPFQKRTARLLRELMKETEVFESEYVFLANYGEPLQPNHFRKQLKQYAERADVNRRVHPHLFRHTGATMALESGMDIRHLQIILGHSDLRQVMVYTHLSGKSIAKQHDQYSPLNAVVGKLNKERKILR